MRRLTTPPADERGAIVVLMAVFIVVMVAMAALVIDVGSSLDEKRQLQNGADAAALAVAQSCAQAVCDPTLAQGLADQNAHDAHTRVDSPTPMLDMVNKRVTVKTSTSDAANGSILPFNFGQVLTGVKGDTLHATAVATWSGLKRATVVPLTLSKCEFDRATVNNTVFNTPAVIVFHKNASSCAGSSGADVPGGYGWLKDENDSNPGDCNVTPAANDTVRDDTGVVGTPHSCNLASVLGTDVLFPIYDSLTGTGANGIYHVYGFGELHVTGYRFSSSNSGGAAPCRSPLTCVGGYFVRFVPTGESGGPSLGNRVSLVS